MDAFWTIVAVILLLGLLAQGLASLLESRAERRRTARRLTAIERQLQGINEHLGIVVPDPDLAPVLEHLRQGQKIAAIKEYRERKGAGLAEAKNAVEELAQQHGI